jgi:hypothetical protein
VDTEQPIQRAAQRDQTSQELRAAHGDRASELTTPAMRDDHRWFPGGIDMAGQRLFDGDRGALPAGDAVLSRCQQWTTTPAL